MLGRRGDGGGLNRTIVAIAGTVIVCGCLAGAALAYKDRTGALTPIILVASVLGGLLYEGDASVMEVVPSVVVIALAAALLGPVSAGLAAILTELCVAIRFRTALTLELAVNLPACVVPAVAEGILVHAFAWPPQNVAWFYVVVAIAGAVGYLLSYPILLVMASLHGTVGRGPSLQGLIDPLASTAISLALGVAGVGIELEIGTAGIAFALAAVIAFSYMIHLLRQSRHRAEQYASLSWGVLAGLLRSLDIRDERTARHSAAVARFSRDIAAAVGMDAAECELAHAAGLLHDIGRFALSDRVFERGRPLAEEDWEAIQRHPELGADMLRDLGMYGPVAEIVLCHHERIDGLGYPRRLRAEEIPEIAKIIAVAEVYDTLTASDTYRTRQSSFEALTELRRVSGSQLDGRYVEVLASLLTGEGVDYRHADAVDFDEELGIEQIIKHAGTGR
jgi:putative nucleotidyltransferase with HDIG domain